MAREKLIEQIGCRVDESTAMQFRACAEADGFTESELVRQLIDAYLHERRELYSRLTSIFGDKPKDGNQNRE